MVVLLVAFFFFYLPNLAVIEVEFDHLHCVPGLAQCAELCWQLRGVAGDRQVRNAMTALQHNLGLGGAAIVTLYRLGFPEYVR